MIEFTIMARRPQETTRLIKEATSAEVVDCSNRQEKHSLSSNQDVACSEFQRKRIRKLRDIVIWLLKSRRCGT